jgi:saccharopine dehydrogenase-like NADP-dependent oxidoreductase
LSDRKSGIQITTASAICAVLDVLSEGALPQSGLIKQEEIALRLFLVNRFDSCYALPVTAAANAA